jgi:hypothetical protein
MQNSLFNKAVLNSMRLLRFAVARLAMTVYSIWFPSLEGGLIK